MADFSANVPVTITNTTGTVGAVISGALTGVTSTVNIGTTGTVSAFTGKVGWAPVQKNQVINVFASTIVWIAASGSVFITDMILSASTALNAVISSSNTATIAGPFYFGNYGGLLADFITPLIAPSGTVAVGNSAGTLSITLIGYEGT